MFDTVAADNDVKIFPWVIIDGKAAGIISSNFCADGSADATGSYNFYPLKGFRDELLLAAPFEKQ